ncbi:MAG: putative quinol monooxygenase [Enterococcus sp.]
MKVINAKFYIKEEKRTEFLEAVRPLILATREEAGCLAYDMYESIDTPNQFVMIENWANQAAIEGHNQSPLLKQLFGQLPEFSAAKAELMVMDKED